MFDLPMPSFDILDLFYWISGSLLFACCLFFCFHHNHVSRVKSECYSLYTRGQVCHNLKCEHQYFKEILLGHKKFEIRNNDRCFKTEDSIVMGEIDSSGVHTGRKLKANIGYISDFMQFPNYVVFSLLDVELIDAN